MHRQHFEYRTAIAYDNGTFAGLSHRRKARNAVPTDGGSKGHAAEEGEKAPPSTISADKCGTCTVLRSLLQKVHYVGHGTYGPLSAYVCPGR